MKESVQILTEEVSANEKAMFIKRATSSGQITLLTRSFGRGTDFICRDKTVASNGGTHVIQVFLSEELSEETQIQGRTARQGDHGSYSMILLDGSLEKFLITEEELKKVKTQGGVYQMLNEKRNIYFQAQYSEIEKYVKEAKLIHDQTEVFISSIDNGDVNYIKEFLKERNKGAIEQTSSRTICLMDATGSMSHLLQKAKNTIETMFNRASTILKENQIDPLSFELQFAVYRNYNSKEDKILQVSAWESKPENLRNFMGNIKPEGGWGNEAVEIGLWHVIEEAKSESGVTQVILIGDAAPNEENEVKMKRAEGHETFWKSGGENYWKGTKFSVPIYYKPLLQQFKSHNIPIHAFYVNDYAKASFQNISKETNGKSEFLDINSNAGADMLTDLITEEILTNVGGSTKGTALVQAYRKKYPKGYKN